jgi:hypothetical protein
MVVLHHVGDLQILMIDRVEAALQLVRHFILEVVPLPLHLLMRLGEQLDCLTAGITPPACGGRLCVAPF